MHLYIAGTVFYGFKCKDFLVLTVKYNYLIKYMNINTPYSKLPPYSLIIEYLNVYHG